MKTGKFKHSNSSFDDESMFFHTFECFVVYLIESVSKTSPYPAKDVGGRLSAGSVPTLPASCFSTFFIASIRGFWVSKKFTFSSQ